MVSSTQLGQIIKQARNKAGITQDDLSDKAGLAYSTLAKIEQGAIKAPSFFTISAIAEALEMDIGELADSEKYKGENGNAGALRRPENKIKFVYSDMNGVMVRFYHRAFAAISKETGCNLELVETTFWHYNDTANEGKMTVEEFNRAIAQHLGVEKVDWKSHYIEAVKPIEVLQRYLEEIQGKVKVGMLTNTVLGIVDELNSRGMLPNMKFDAVIDSSVEGVVKPSSKIYEIAEKKAGYKGSEILFIDDSRANLSAAEKMGWQVMWFDEYEPEESVQRLREVIDSI